MVNVEPTFGPELIGAFLNTFLYGILVLQVITYYQNYKRDPKWIRYLILYLFICETVNTLCDIGTVYEPLVIRFGTERAIARTATLFPANPFLTVMISTPVQLFICWRITVLLRIFSSRIKIMAFAIAFLSFISLAGGIAATVFLSQVTPLTDSRANDNVRWAVSLWLVPSTVADVSITICLVWSLRKCRTGFEGTDDVINKNIRFAIQTGALTSLFTIMDFTLFQTATTTTANLVFNFAVVKLYANSLLSTFNARPVSSSKDDKAEYNVLFGSPET